MRLAVQDWGAEIAMLLTTVSRYPIWSSLIAPTRLRDALLALAVLGYGSAEASGIRYQVKPGETLFRIAHRTGFSESQIQRANPALRGITLYAGQMITIPLRPLPPGGCRVRQGESLKALARRLGVSEAEIRRANPKIDKRGSLNAGQILRLPAKLIAAQRANEKKLRLARRKKAAELARKQAAARKLQLAKARALVTRKPPNRPTTHQVQFGETFFSIARRYGLNPLELQRINPRYAGNLLTVGTVLTLVPRPASAPKVKPRPRAIVIRQTKNRPPVWIWPVPGHGRITSEFGWRTMNEKQERHTGIDVSAPTGTPVVAARSGRVVEAYYDKSYGWGRTVVIQHPDGWKTRYAHLDSISAESGQLIRQGQTLGTVGGTGRVTGVHLHFGIYRNDAPLNPLALYQAEGD